MWRPKGDLGPRKNPLTDCCWVSGPELNCFIVASIRIACLQTPQAVDGREAALCRGKKMAVESGPWSWGNWCCGPSGDFPFQCSPALPVKDAFGIMSFFLWTSSVSQTHPPGLRSELQEGASRVILLGPLLS